MNHNQNFVQEGEVVTLTMPYARASSGLGVQVGAIFGVTMDAYDNAASGRVEREGIHTLAKTSAQAWTQGQRLFWDDTNKRLDSDSTVGMFVGAAYEAAANPSSTGKVLLMPASPLLEGAQAAEAALTGTLTGTANGSMVDVAATAGACAGGATPTATNVDTAIATAVASIVTGTNEQLKELQTKLNAALAKLVLAGILTA